MGVVVGTSDMLRLTGGVGRAPFVEHVARIQKGMAQCRERGSCSLGIGGRPSTGGAQQATNRQEKNTNNDALPPNQRQRLLFCVVAAVCMRWDEEGGGVPSDSGYARGIQRSPTAVAAPTPSPLHPRPRGAHPPLRAGRKGAAPRHPGPVRQRQCCNPWARRRGRIRGGCGRARSARWAAPRAARQGRGLSTRADSRSRGRAAWIRSFLASPSPRF